MKKLGEPLLEYDQLIIEVNDNKFNDENEFKNSLAPILRQRLNERLENNPTSQAALEIVFKNWDKEDIRFINREFEKEYTEAKRTVWCQAGGIIGSGIGIASGLFLSILGTSRANEGEDQYLKFLVSGVAIFFLSLGSYCYIYKYNNVSMGERLVAILSERLVAIVNKFVDELCRSSSPKKRKETVINIFNDTNIMHKDVHDLIGNYIYTPNS